jgi:hypothetical protein
MRQSTEKGDPVLAATLVIPGIVVLILIVLLVIFLLGRA